MDQRLDLFMGPTKAPDVEISPITGSVDLVWVAPCGPYRIVLSLGSSKELRVLMQRAIEALQDERTREGVAETA